MNSAAFLSAVKEEIARLQQIRNLLENDSTDPSTRNSTKAFPAKRGGMTAEGRARVAEAQRKRWAAKKAAAETAATPAPPIAKKKKIAAPVNKSAKTVEAVPPVKKQTASVSKPAASKTAAPVKKVTVKKSAVATRPAAAKKATAAKKNSVGQAAPRKQVRNVRTQPDSNIRSEAREANAPVVDAAPAVTEDSSSNE